MSNITQIESHFGERLLEGRAAVIVETGSSLLQYGDIIESHMVISKCKDAKSQFGEAKIFAICRTNGACETKEFTG